MLDQGKINSMAPPRAGATAGATAISIAIMDKAFAALVAPKTSRTMARARVGPTQAPTPCNTLNSSSSLMVSAWLQPILANTKMAVP